MEASKDEHGRNKLLQRAACPLFQQMIAHSLVCCCRYDAAHDMEARQAHVFNRTFLSEQLTLLYMLVCAAAGTMLLTTWRPAKMSMAGTGTWRRTSSRREWPTT
jgi:hypothetical protein